MSGISSRLRARVGEREVDVELSSSAWPEVRATVGGVSLEVRLAQIGPGAYWFTLDGRSIEARVARRGEGYRVECGGESFDIRLLDRRQRLRSVSGSAAGGRTEVRAPMPGQVIDVRVATNARIRAGESLVILEAMKMQNAIASPRDGVVSVHVAAGQTVEAGQLLATVGENG
jgi:3-methylcrotonyl-CoA carboxylase alpha subunit